MQRQHRTMTAYGFVQKHRPELSLIYGESSRLYHVILMQLSAFVKKFLHDSVKIKNVRKIIKNP
jgi:hypothetical protein